MQLTFRSSGGKKISLFQHSHSASIKHYHGRCGGGVGGRGGVDELIADHRQLTGRDSALSPVMAQQDNNDN